MRLATAVELLIVVGASALLVVAFFAARGLVAAFAATLVVGLVLAWPVGVVAEKRPPVVLRG